MQKSKNLKRNKIKDDKYILPFFSFHFHFYDSFMTQS